MNDKKLIQNYLLGQASESETQELVRLLADSAQLRRQFVLDAATDAGLREVALQRASEPLQPLARTKNKRGYIWAALLTVVAAAVVTITIGPRLFQKSSIATLVSSEDAAWESSLPTTPGSDLNAGVLKLKAGVATVKFHSGAEMVLEAPAHLELMTPMRSKLLAGTAVIDVPESAVGFVVETPAGYAVDYGTQFAVRVDHGRSDFELIEGEISVHHSQSGEQVRLTDPGKAAKISARSLNVVDMEDQQDAAQPSSRVIRVDTNGRATSVRRFGTSKWPFPEVLSVKRTNSGKRDHHSFFAFDLTKIDINQVESAELRLNLVPSTRGYAARLPKINRFGVYGLTNEAKKDWRTDCIWEDAPSAVDGVLLGTFDVPRSRQRGNFGIRDCKLLEFLRANQSQEVTLIVVRETTQVQGFGPGLTHTFASDSHPESVGPTLELTLAQ